MKAVYEHGATTHHEIANLRRELAELKARVAALESATPKPTDDGDLNIAANEIERRKAELTAANARLNSAYVKIGDLFKECEDHAKFAHKLKLELAASNAKIEAARESDRIDLLLALGIESPKPPDHD